MIHTSAQKSMKDRVREGNTHVIVKISVAGGALALSLAGVAASIGKIRVDAPGALQKRITIRMLTTKSQPNGSSKRRRLGVSII